MAPWLRAAGQSRDLRSLRGLGLRLRGGQTLDDGVAQVLRTLGLERHAAAFEREGIHTRNLVDLTDDDLGELGLLEPDRQAFLAHVSFAQKQAPAQAKLAAERTWKVASGKRSKQGESNSLHVARQPKKSRTGVAAGKLEEDNPGKSVPAENHPGKQGEKEGGGGTHLERLLLLLSGAHARSSREAAGCALAQVFCDQPAYQAHIAAHLQRLVRHTSWDTRDAAASTLSHILAASPCTSPASQARHCLTPDRRSFAGGVLRSFDLEGELLARQDQILLECAEHAPDEGRSHQQVLSQTQQTTTEPQGSGKSDSLAGASITLGYCGGGAGGAEEVERGPWWPFDGLCEEFYSDLLDQAWQRRHGAALALKHLLRHHPCLIPTTFAEPAPARTSRCGWGATRAFAEECGTQLLRVLALDRFSDFSGDLVVSPVREASAQALALLVQTLDTKCTSDTRRNGRDVDTDAGNADSQNCSAAAEDSAADSGVVVHVVDMLERMMKWQEDWELRHSALIVLKYMVALSPQSAGSLKRAVSMAGWRMVMAGLVDDSDDVRCVAAQAALALARDGVSPASPAAATAAEPAAVLGRGESQETKASASAHQDPDRTFDCIVWESLEECDQLSSSTAPLLQLLSWRLGELHAKDGGVRAQDMRDLFGDNLSRLKRVLSFMAHHLVSVRGAAIDILERVVAAYPALLLPDPRGGGATREGGFAAEALEVVYLSALIETREHLTPRLQSLWQQIVCQVACGGPRWFQAAVRMREWCEAAATPQHHPLSLRSICRSQEYLQCLSSSASHTAAAEAAGPRSKHTGGERACVGKGKGRGKGKGEKDGTAGGSSTYDIGTRTREVACRMMACLLRAQPSEIGGETRENWAVVERMALSSNPWSAFVASWVSMEALSFSLPPSPHAASTRGDRLETEKGKCEGNGGAELRLPARVLASLESLVPAGASNSAAPLQRDTAALAAGCLLLSREPGAGDISQEALSEARAGSSAAESRKSEAGQRWQGSQGKGSDAQREQAASLMQVLLEAVASQSDAFMQQRTARVVTLLAQRRLLAASHTSALCADVCLEPSITPLPGAALPDHSDTAQEDSGCRGVTAETLLRSVPKSGLEDLTSLAEMSVSGAQADSGDRRGVVMRRVRQRGAQSVLESAAAGLGEDLLVCLPLVWEVSGAVLGQDQHVSDARMIKALQLVEVLLPHSARGVGARMSEAVLAVIARILTRSNAGARHMAARACARVAGFDPLGAIEVLVRQVLPMLQEAGSPIVDARLGAIEAVYRTIQELGERLLPYAVLFLSPVLARMSDSDPAVRETATRSFAVLLQALPLERSVPDPVGLPPDLVAGRQRERRVLEQLCDPTALDAYSISANLTAELRPYQQEGVNWLGFLVTYNLHGILCDDMGLGKTLQTIAVLASDTVNRRARFRETGLDCHRPLPSLIVCPSTLVPHWCHEVSKFCRDVEAVAYGGSAAHRNATLGSLDGSDKLLVVSYEAVRGDIELFLSRRDPSWNFAVLDEGHIIKNPKSKLTQAVKRVGLGAAHRLILTGTPIQNNVLELWGLFDFLMPSFLGSDRDFNSRYSKPILASGRDLRVDRQRFAKQRGGRGRLDSAERLSNVPPDAGVVEESRQYALVLEAADAALDALHRQVLPFMLRRTKQQVLHDLPPKIITDVLCPMTALQKALLEALDGKGTLAQLEQTDTLTAAEEASRLGHDAEAGAGTSAPKALSALLQLKRLANHPVLLLEGGRSKPGGNVDESAWRQMFQQQCPGLNPHDVDVAPKFKALLQLLADCGVGAMMGCGKDGGVGEDDEQRSETAGVGNGGGLHRVLVFSQTREMLDLIQQDVLQRHFPTVRYLRMDGSTPAPRRFDMQQEFNADPNIQLMLLTTHVGGLGLTLTGADTVVFVDHDWNPMRDLQAMDRAHRIGQTKTVNVYRLIAQGSLEERIMGLQRFKLNVANTVVSDDNSQLGTMATSTVLDLMAPRSAGGDAGSSGVDVLKKKRIKGLNRKELGPVGVEEGELWDEEQYRTFDVDAFAEEEREQKRERERQNVVPTW